MSSTRKPFRHSKREVLSTHVNCTRPPGSAAKGLAQGEHIDSPLRTTCSRRHCAGNARPSWAWHTQQPPATQPACIAVVLPFFRHPPSAIRGLLTANSSSRRPLSPCPPPSPNPDVTCNEGYGGSAQSAHLRTWPNEHTPPRSLLCGRACHCITVNAHCDARQFCKGASRHGKTEQRALRHAQRCAGVLLDCCSPSKAPEAAGPIATPPA